MMKKASEILSGFLDTAQLEKAKNYSSFFRSWRTIVGLDIASHTRVHEIEGWKLIIQADHPGWAQKIEWKKRAILKEVGKRYPELGITDIRVWIVDKLMDPPEPVIPAALQSRDSRQDPPPPPPSSPVEKVTDDGGKKEALNKHLQELGKLIKEADKKRRH